MTSRCSEQPFLPNKVHELQTLLIGSHSKSGARTVCSLETWSLRLLTSCLRYAISLTKVSIVSTYDVILPYISRKIFSPLMNDDFIEILEFIEIRRMVVKDDFVGYEPSPGCQEGCCFVRDPQRGSADFHDIFCIKVHNISCPR